MRETTPNALIGGAIEAVVVFCAVVGFFALMSVFGLFPQETAPLLLAVAGAFGWASTQDLDDMVALALRVNDFLSGLFLGVGIQLVDFKVEFGRLWENEEVRIVLADEISPDNCRLWDAKTGEKMDKDRFRRDLGNVEEGYQEVARRLGILPEAGVRDLKGPELMQ